MELKPIAAVRIGCVVEGGGAMHGTVLDRSAKITALNPLEQIECSISGESDRVYTSQTNQASASMSGSYGASGVAKLSAAVSAYVGYSSASSSKSIEFERIWKLAKRYAEDNGIAEV